MPVAIALFLTAAAAAASPPACEVGAYRGPADDFVAITERADTATTREWRYAFRDGRYGGTKDGPVTCGKGHVRVGLKVWPKIAFRTTRTGFPSGDIALAGQLIEPPMAKGKKPPLVVCVHGSENSAWIDRSSYPYMLAAQGISVFLFDKRGTGASGGTYNQNFHKLAADVVAASVEAKRLVRGRYAGFGLFGGSQGGWVAPRAANDAGADFVAVGFGLLIDPLEEDAEQVASELREHGYGDDIVARAHEVTDATGALMAAHFETGYDRLATVKARFGAEPWFARIKGEFTGDILAGDEATLRREGRAKYDNLDIDWHYDAIGRLREVKARQLWIVAGEDREAPPVVTIARLQSLRREGRPIRIVRFPNTDHGMMEFRQAPDGTRRNVRVTEGYYRLLADWIKGENRPPYGAAEMLAPE